MLIGKKRHLIAGTIIGGLLLAATTLTGNSFALSDTSSGSASTPSATQQVSTNTSNTTQPTSTTPSTDNATVAAGSTATQTSSNTTGVTSSENASSLGAVSSVPAITSPAAPTGTQPSDPGVSTAGTAQTNNTTATNTVTSQATTGDAIVKNTATGGNASTGDASAIATLMNAIASTTSLGGGSLQTYTYNVDGSHIGNIVIDPKQILSAAGSTPDPNTCPPTGTTTALNDTTINNTLNLHAKSGSATVANNGVGGDATSGNATTEATVVNIVEATINNQGASLGIVNVNGSLAGNILLPANAVDAALAPVSSTDASTTAVNNLKINNNVSLAATSGTAVVTNNGAAGNVTSGDASTILNTCNLINSRIAGGNLLLVFVNDLGHWSGTILNEPAGTTSATLGGSITKDTLLSATHTTATNNTTVNNDLNLVSMSGSATVANNGVGGDATTGHAAAIADVANILGSQIDLSGWLGILIINVFGTWNGSVAIQQPTTTSSTAPPVHHVNPQPSHAPTATALRNVHEDSNRTLYASAPSQSFGQDHYALSSAHILEATTTPSHDTAIIKHVAGAVSNHVTSRNRNITLEYLLAGIGSAIVVAGVVGSVVADRRAKK